jgi:hypothetical protein
MWARDWHAVLPETLKMKFDGLVYQTGDLVPALTDGDATW